MIVRAIENIDKLNRQLKKILKSHDVNKTTFFAMGSDYNVRLMMDYFDQYSTKFEAKLDNNKKLQGNMLANIPIMSPEKALIPFKPNAFVLIFSPRYYAQMKTQLEGLGYMENENFVSIQDFRVLEDKSSLVKRSIWKVRRGERIYYSLKKKYGFDVHIFIARGGTGDSYLNGLFLDSYAKKKKIENYVVAGDARGLLPVLALFGINNVKILSTKEVEELQQYYMFFYVEDITHLFPWKHTLYLNRCRAKMRSPFTFIETYIYYTYCNMVSLEDAAKPVFARLSNEIIERCKKKGIEKQKTVIAAPFANTVNYLPIWFWNRVFSGLRERGYKVLVNIDETRDINPFMDTESIFFDYKELEAVLKYAGFFLALRSGLCEITSSVDCSQVILYPERQEPLNLDIHRVDVEFSGLKELSRNRKLVEISSKAILGKDNLETVDDYDLFHKYDSLISRILENYPVVNSTEC